MYTHTHTTHTVAQQSAECQQADLPGVSTKLGVPRRIKKSSRREKETERKRTAAVKDHL
jgi:hypothetical protein